LREADDNPVIFVKFREKRGRGRLMTWPRSRDHSEVDLAAILAQFLPYQLLSPLAIHQGPGRDIHFRVLEERPLRTRLQFELAFQLSRFSFLPP
jgi:hypothetical protein